jgi:pimeloyl-ACP methyl ester carboxylesterase
MQLDQTFREIRPAPAPAVSAQALGAALPGMTEEMNRINRLLDAGRRHAAIEQFHALASVAIRTQRHDLLCRGYLIQGRTTEISVCRIPAQPRPGKPIALFLPGLLAALPLTAVRALAFVDLFDIVLCELPGHGASGEVADVSIAAFAAECAALIGTALQRAASLFVIGESLGGLVALTLASLRPGQIRNVILVDTPFHLTWPDLAAWISEAWRNTGRRPYVRCICQEIMGFDPADGRAERTTLHHDLVRNAAFDCLLIMGSDQQSSGIASVIDNTDIAALRTANPKLLILPRIRGTGHAVLLDNPEGARAALETLIVRKVPDRSCHAFPL